MVLGMVWTLILRFAIADISEGEKSAKEGLLLWCQRKTEKYENVDIQDFTMSWKDGLGFCALIHRHRPDLIDYSSLESGNAKENLELAFDVAERELDIPRLLDAEDIVDLPRPDERSIITYVSQYFYAFASMDKVEVAGRRVNAAIDFTINRQQMIASYEQECANLVGSINGKIAELQNREFGSTYVEGKEKVVEFNTYKSGDKRDFIKMKAHLEATLAQIQVKSAANNRPNYVPAEGCRTEDLDAIWGELLENERQYSKAINNNLKTIKEDLRLAFAEQANEFYSKTETWRHALLADNSGSELEAQCEGLVSGLGEINAEADQILAALSQLEAKLAEANVDDNEHTIFTVDDLQFEFDQVAMAYREQISTLENQIATKNMGQVTAEQIEQFTETFQHFDSDGSNTLDTNEFRAGLAGLGQAFSDEEYEAVFNSVSLDGELIQFEQFVEYMVSITEDSTTPEQLFDSFNIVANGKEYVTVEELQMAQVEAATIEWAIQNMPPYEGQEGSLDFKAWMSAIFD
eukprot:TRINITY_DN11572_c0_g1_i2.p1 TRINITY_DN11572_c0_g1~~TRINITY_DN11572_c0_g1_i2.p1  ORF type:complete len:521 (+),score=224.50 TRINITY_DN11572_c0_g1_i2:821-2383(+)